MRGKNYKDYHILSLGGVQIPRKDSEILSKTPIALEQFLQDFPDVRKIIFKDDQYDIAPYPIINGIAELYKFAIGTS